VLALLPGFALLALLGYLNLAAAQALPLNAPLRRYAASRQAMPGERRGLRLEGRVASLPKFQRGHLRFMLDVLHVRPATPRPADGQPWPPALPWETRPGRCLVFLQVKRGTAPPEVNYGDVLQLTAEVEEVPPPRNRGQFDYRAWLLQQGTVLSAYSFGGGGLHVVLPAGNGLWPLLARLRERLTARLAQHAPPALAPLAVSVVYGDKITDLPEATTQTFQRAGLSHILVASGTQVSLLIALLAALGWRQRGDFSLHALPGRLAVGGLTLAIVFTYAGIAGLETSILRALVMGVIVLAAQLLRRESDGLTSLSQAALVVLIANPQQLFNAGFQLSFGATFGLIYLNGITLPWIKQFGAPPTGLPPRESTAPGWRGWLERLSLRFPGWRRQAAVVALEALSTTIGAQLFVIPVLAAGFNQLSLWGFASNALAVPLSFALLIAGGAASLGLGAMPGLGGVCTWAVGGLTEWLAAVASFFGHLPGANLAVPTPPWWCLAAAYGALLLGGEWIKQRRDQPAAEPAGSPSPAPAPAGWAGAILPAASLACLLTVTAGFAYWLLVPQPELAALALPGSEAYLWRPVAQPPWLILRSRGLPHNHNADTVLSSLRVRGINRLGGVVWVDQPPQPDPLADFAAPRYAPGALLPPDCRLRWLLQPDGRVFGMAVPTGAQDSCIFWDSPGGAIPELLALGGQGRQPPLLLLRQPLAEQLRPGTLKALAHVAPLCVLDGRAQWPAAPAPEPLPGVSLASPAELSLRLHGTALWLAQQGGRQARLPLP
jgi:ComEC/Rec2-related protein